METVHERVLHSEPATKGGQASVSGLGPFAAPIVKPEGGDDRTEMGPRNDQPPLPRRAPYNVDLGCGCFSRRWSLGVPTAASSSLSEANSPYAPSGSLVRSITCAWAVFNITIT